MDDLDGEISEWLANWEAGNRLEIERLPNAVYWEMRKLAAQRLAKERNNHTLQPTALVNEVFLLLMKMKHVKLEGESHFMKLVAHMMRNILVDYARRRRARGGNLRRVPLEEAGQPSREPPMEDVIAIHLALEKLTQVDERLSTVVELRYFVGLTIEQVAELLNTSKATIEREWRTAKTFLQVELGRGRA